MKEKKLTDEEIIKANLDADCLACVYGEHCETCVLRDIESCEVVPSAVVDLINRQKAEIERLKIDLANERNWGKIQTKQAVKDTAKEILDEVSKHFGGKWLVELYKKYGLDWIMEVE